MASAPRRSVTFGCAELFGDLRQTRLDLSMTGLCQLVALVEVHFPITEGADLGLQTCQLRSGFVRTLHRTRRGKVKALHLLLRCAGACPEGIDLPCELCQPLAAISDST